MAAKKKAPQAKTKAKAKTKTKAKTEQNSLVANINRKKRAGTSRPKSRSTISSDAYRQMQEGWPRKKKARKKR